MVITIEVPGDQIEVHGNIPPGRIITATLVIEDGVAAAASASVDPASRSFEEWEKDFNEMCTLAPENEFPADVSREAMYLSDEELGRQ